AASKGRGVGLCLLNPQSNPQFEWSCTTCSAFGSPRVLVSCCKAISRCLVTAEAAGSSPESFWVCELALAQLRGVGGVRCPPACLATRITSYSVISGLCRNLCHNST